jgi:tetratricopeptide (TPR) repeat protein
VFACLQLADCIDVHGCPISGDIFRNVSPPAASKKDATASLVDATRPAASTSADSAVAATTVSTSADSAVAATTVAIIPSDSTTATSSADATTTTVARTSTPTAALITAVANSAIGSGTDAAAISASEVAAAAATATAMTATAAAASVVALPADLTLSPAAVASLYFDVTQMLRLIGCTSEAAAANRTCMQLRLRHLGDASEQAADAVNMAAILETDMKRYEPAIELYELASHIFKRSKCNPSVEVVSTINRAICLRLLKRFPEAREDLERALARLNEAFPFAHPRKAVCYLSLANLLYRGNDIIAAVFNMEKALEIYTLTVGGRSESAAKAHSNLGMFLNHLCHYPEAEAHLQECISIRRNSTRCKDTDKSLVAPFGMLVFALAMQQRYADAEGTNDTLFEPARVATKSEVLEDDASIILGRARVLFHCKHKPIEAQALAELARSVAKVDNFPDIEQSADELIAELAEPIAMERAMAEAVQEETTAMSEA